MICKDYNVLYRLPYTILRYGVAYGSRVRDATVIATFVRKALNGEAITIMGNGSQYRNFIYADDLALGNVAALEDVAKNQTYNLEGIRPVTIKEVAETVKKLVGNVSIEYEEAKTGDYAGKIVSTKKASKELNWQPKVDLEEGVTRYIQWYKDSKLKN